MFPSFAEINHDDEIIRTFNMTRGYSEISPEIAHAILAHKLALLIDVRTAEEFAEGHIEGALNLPEEAIVADQRLTQAPSPNTPLILYCKTGNRASKAAAKLLAAGYLYVMNMGGIYHWPFGLVQ